MDITLLRQGKRFTEDIKHKRFDYISGGDISNLSKSALMILYRCGKRPLYIFEGSSQNGHISLHSQPQAVPDCILCGKDKHSVQSARVIQEQMQRMETPVRILKLSSLSETALSEEHLKRFYSNLIRHTFQSLEKKGLKHIIVVANQKELNAIYQAITHSDTALSDDSSEMMIALSDGKEKFRYNPNNADYITEGMLDTLLVNTINSSKCPENCLPFKGKVKKAIPNEVLFYKFRSHLK